MTLISNSDSMVHYITKDMAYTGELNNTGEDFNHFYLVKNDCRQWARVPKHIFTMVRSK